MAAEPTGAEPRWRRYGPPYELTREELLAELHRRGHTLSEHTLQVWARNGIIPRPTRHLPPGSTDGVARAMYAADLLPVLERLLRETGPGVPLAAKRRLAAAPTYTGSGALTLPVLTMTGTGTFTPATPPTPRLAAVLRQAVWRFARQLAARRGIQIAGVALVIRPAEGEPIAIEVSRPTDE